MGPAVTAGDAEIVEQKGQALGGHGRASIGVEGKLAADDLLAKQSFLQ
jgi:hypothetical protein